MGLNKDGSGALRGGVWICPSCLGPNCFDMASRQFPAVLLGNPVKHVPDDLHELYEEARTCAQHSAFTAAVMLLRKMLMNIAVKEGAASGQSFVQYVDYLSTNGFIPKNGKPWVDKIRTIGNEANHEIHSKSQADTEQLLSFVEMILKTNYEFLHGVAAP